MNTYDQNITCENCESEDTYEIPVGRRWPDYAAKKKCEYCGCYLCTKWNNDEPTPKDEQPITTKREVEKQPTDDW